MMQGLKCKSRFVERYIIFLLDTHSANDQCKCLPFDWLKSSCYMLFCVNQQKLTETNDFPMLHPIPKKLYLLKKHNFLYLHAIKVATFCPTCDGLCFYHSAICNTRSTVDQIQLQKLCFQHLTETQPLPYPAYFKKLTTAYFKKQQGYAYIEYLIRHHQMYCVITNIFLHYFDINNFICIFDINISTKSEMLSCGNCSFHVHWHFMFLIWFLIINACIHGTNMMRSSVMIVTRHLILTL